MVNPGKAHWEAVKWILRYLKEECDISLSKVHTNENPADMLIKVVTEGRRVKVVKVVKAAPRRHVQAPRRPDCGAKAECWRLGAPKKMIYFVSFILFIIFLYKWATSKSKKRLLPSPAKLPVIGNLHQLGLHPHRSLKELSERYGPLMMLHLGSVPALIVTSADAVREIVKNQDLIFSSRPKLSVMHRIVYGSKDIAFARYGDHWRHVRSIGVLQLLSNKRVQSCRHIREEETVVLGKKYGGGEESENFELMLKEIGELLVTFNPGDFVPWLNWVSRVNGLDARLEKVAESFDEFLTRVVEEHRSRIVVGNSTNAIKRRNKISKKINSK
ncbi:cytochrome P450 71A3-like [Olea europaea var. sylvestris]|uniref:cytochrome P450 71A3-like n=1 Tax=Olea europaea var. sylvestris TaxID=158386 RepID=UPI000C1D86EF|nr:cytochrome P450 71A3-like [Olea europaea var. sylvestris]